MTMDCIDQARKLQKLADEVRFRLSCGRTMKIRARLASRIRQALDQEEADVSLSYYEYKELARDASASEMGSRAGL